MHGNMLQLEVGHELQQLMLMLESMLSLLLRFDVTQQRPHQPMAASHAVQEMMKVYQAESDCSSPTVLGVCLGLKCLEGYEGSFSYFASLREVKMKGCLGLALHLVFDFSRSA